MMKLDRVALGFRGHGPLAQYIYAYLIYLTLAGISLLCGLRCYWPPVGLSSVYEKPSYLFVIMGLDGAVDIYTVLLGDVSGVFKTLSLVPL